MGRQRNIALLGVAVFLIAACAGATPEPANTTIEMSEYAFNPAELEFEVGQEVTLTLVNKGVLDHEIMFGRDVMMMNNRPSGYQIDLFETAGVEPVVETEAMEMSEHEEEEGHTGFMVFLPVGDTTTTMKFTVTEEMVGEWEMGCFEQDGVHYDAGMVGKLVIKP